MTHPKSRIGWRTRLAGGLGARLGLWRRATTLGVRAMALDSQGRVFLVRHTYVEGWYLPGGGVEKGETIYQALARELAEEGAIRLTGAPILQSFHLNGARDHVALFVTRDFVQDAPKVPDLEIAESGFFDPKQLPVGATRATRARLSEVLDGLASDPLW